MDAYKNTNAPTRSGEKTQSIKLSHPTLSSMLEKGATHINMLQATAPVQFERAFGLVTGDRADQVLASSKGSPSTKVRDAARPTAIEIFARGTRVRDKKNFAKATIVKSNIGTTPKGNPIHIVVDSEGNQWRQNQSQLEKL